MKIEIEDHDPSSLLWEEVQVGEFCEDINGRILMKLPENQAINLENQHIYSPWVCQKRERVRLLKIVAHRTGPLVEGA